MVDYLSRVNIRTKFLIIQGRDRGPESRENERCHTDSFEEVPQPINVGDLQKLRTVRKGLSQGLSPNICGRKANTCIAYF